MQALSMPSRLWFAVVLVLVSTLFSGARAQDAQPVATPWQDVITAQVQAFRDRDAKTALSFAGRGFQATFPSPETFFVTIMRSGYTPIMESRSHSFGAFQMVGGKSVAQQVTFTGANQQLYDAVYLLTEEESGWRVQGVQLTQTGAVGI